MKTEEGTTDHAQLATMNKFRVSAVKVPMKQLLRKAWNFIL